MESRMIPVTHNSLPLFVIPWEPDWRTSVQAGLELLAEVETGLTNREARRPYGRHLRVVLEFGLTLNGSDATRFAAGLRAWTTDLVAVPFWPGAVPWSQRHDAPFQSRIRLAYLPGFSIWDLFEPGSEPMWADSEAMVVPVLLGRIERQEPRWLTPTVCSVDVTFVEQSPADYALSVATQEWTAGPEPSAAWADHPPALLPFQIHHDRPTMTASVEIIRERLGFGRSPVETFHGQAPVRSGEAAMLETGTAIAALSRFFVDHGAGRPFWAASWAAAAILKAPITDGSATLEVQAGHDVRPGDWLMVGDRSARASATAEDEITLEEEVDAHPQATLISHLLLCRFDRPRMRFEWQSPTVVRATLAVRELPAEYSPAEGETLGGTLGLLPHRVWLYELREPTQNDGATIHRYTSFEHDLEVDGETYLAARIDHGAIRQGIAMDRDEVEVRMEVPSDVHHPLVRFATLRTESPMTLTIRRADVLVH
jgi:hypothetical protein